MPERRRHLLPAKQRSTQAAVRAAEGRAKARVDAMKKTIDMKIQALQDRRPVDL
jgi:hypothetical protein